MEKKFIKDFNSFIKEELTATSPVPTRERPAPAPTTVPGTPRPSRPRRPSPIRRDKPGINPDPKALKDLKKGTMQDVIDKFAKLTDQYEKR